MAGDATRDAILSSPDAFTAQLEAVPDPAYRLATVMLRDRTAAEDAVHVHWGLGLSHGACFRAFTLTNPSRLVVDVQS